MSYNDSILSALFLTRLNIREVDMSKRIAYISLLAVVIVVLALSLVACGKDMEFGWETNFQCENVDTLRIVFGKEFIYPNSENVSEIKVNCEPNDGLDEYLTDNNELKEPVYIPTLVKAEMKDIFEDIEVELGIIKNNDERRGWNKLSLDGLKEIEVNGMKLLSNGKFFVYIRQESQYYCLSLFTDNESFAYNEFAYR